MSSYDDRPGHFIAPWQHEEGSSQRALDKIATAVTQVRMMHVIAPFVLAASISSFRPSMLWTRESTTLVGRVLLACACIHLALLPALSTLACIIHHAR